MPCNPPDAGIGLFELPLQDMFMRFKVQLPAHPAAFAKHRAIVPIMSRAVIVLSLIAVIRVMHSLMADEQQRSMKIVRFWKLYS